MIGLQSIRVINLNTGFYENLDTNFEQAFIMSQKDFSHNELINMLQNGNIPEKQIAALKLDSINSNTEAEILAGNLTGCDGKIREAVALKINKLLTNESNIKILFANSNFAKIFADATIDINANICRLVIDSACTLRDFPEFTTTYTQCIVSYTLEALNKLDSFIFRDKKYVINKQLFKLYWCLEGLKYFYEFGDKNQIIEILSRSGIQKEYTVREKVAEILIMEEFSELSELKKALQNDSNYYVRNVFLYHHC